MQSALDSKVLVLNRSWTPVNIVNGFEAVCKLYCDKARVVGEDYTLYNLDEWVETWRDASKLASLAAERQINCVSFMIPVPEVIVLDKYNGYLKQRAKLSRGAIFARDEHRCQYCGKKRPAKQLNIDHVMPRSRGGGSTWKNLVLSCISCNTQKGSRTPQEAGMQLLRKPFEPHWTQIARRRFHGCSVPKSWEDFLGKMYWNVSLDD
ncbi:MAG: 5-methylcytosine-specific restriction endonuclease McrA [Rhodothermales bacterium]|jgi:5-methylcytosine-specific restriction endonuclease McrA